MSVESNMHTLEGEYIEKRALNRFGTAVQKLAEADGLAYMLDESFVASDPDMVDIPNQQIGVYTETGSLENGKYTFVWFNDKAGSILARAQPDYRNLRAQVAFAQDTGKGSVSGAIQLHAYGSGEGDISLSMYGRLEDPDENANYSLFRLCHRLGLGAMYSEVSLAAGRPGEQGIEGNVDSRTAWLMAHALEDLITTGES